MATAWSNRYAQRTNAVRSSVIRELLKLTQRPDVISFAGGLPAPELFPLDRFQQACHTVLKQNGAVALQYGPTEGYLPLRDLIVRHMRRYGIVAEVANVLITCGSQQALDLVGKLLIDPGDPVLTEEPTYLGALQAFNVYGAKYATLPVDHDGMQIDRLHQVLCCGPKFMYVLPNFQNPAGVSLSEDRRDKLVRIANSYGIPIVEDDPYGQLRYEGEHRTPLVVLDRLSLRGDQQYMSGNVIYLSTFSKLLAPGLRLGWIVAPQEVIARLVQLKQGADLHTSSFTQVLAYEVARDGFLDQHVKRLRTAYRERRDTMLAALQDFFPAEAAWTHPEGGLFLWVTLPASINSEELLHAALRQNVAFVPGDSFYPGKPDGCHMRLNFSNSNPEQIREGIRRLGTAVKEHLHATVLAGA
jgi:2-aminoadipate transaminase